MPALRDTLIFVGLLLLIVPFAVRAFVNGQGGRSEQRTPPPPPVEPHPLPVAVALADTPTMAANDSLDPLLLSRLNRMSFGVTAETARAIQAAGPEAYLREQLSPGALELPPAIVERLAAMELGRTPADELARDIYRQQREAAEMPADEAGLAARKKLGERLTELGNEAAQRSILRTLYSPNQLQEKMTRFWMNHFSMSIRKTGPMRALIPDFEENAVHPHALGKFRDLLAATVRHPAMLIYLDNTQNRAGAINENYGRELLELHTLGVDGGYTQDDVKATSRILTGFGINLSGTMPNLPEELRAQHVREGVFEFNPARHDYENKTVLGESIAGEGMAELDRLVELLARHPATARHLARKLAVYFVSDEPPQELVDTMSQAFLDSDGDIAATLAAMFEHPAFEASLRDGSFKDPMQFVMSAVRLLHLDDGPIQNPRTIVHWLSLMGQPLYGRETPDGYPLERSEWQGSGQLTARFDVARRIAGANPQLFEAPGAPQPTDREPPSAGRELYDGLLAASLSEPTREALAAASTQQEWNVLLLASPDFMKD